MRKLAATLIAMLIFAPATVIAVDVANAKDKPAKGAPGPIAGAGLPFLVLVGGYWLYRRRRNQQPSKKLPD